MDLMRGDLVARCSCDLLPSVQRNTAAFPGGQGVKHWGGNSPDASHRSPRLVCELQFQNALRGLKSNRRRYRKPAGLLIFLMVCRLPRRLRVLDLY